MRIEHWRYSVPLWLRGLLRRRDVERELDEELRYHLDEQIAANVSGGMHPDHARRAALIALGGVERRKDESRDVRRLSLIDSIAQVRHAVRSLWRARVFTIATVATIALGIGAGSMMLALVNAVLLRPLPYPDSDRLVGLWHGFPGISMPIAAQAPGTISSYRAQSKALESIGAYSGGTVTIDHNDPSAEPERVPAAGVSGAIFTMLRARPLIGRVLTDADERVGAPDVAVIGERYWRTQLHATPGVVGSHIRIDGANREIVGVLPASFAFPGSEVRVWLPIILPPNPYLGAFGIRAIGRLRDGVSLEAAQRDLQSILIRTPETYPEVHPGMSTAAALAKTRAVVVVHRLRDDAIGGFDHVLWLVAAIVAVLVVVAFSNVASLVLARVESRQREIAVRSTLGASTSRIWWSLLTEAAIVSAAGGGAGVGLAIAGLRVLTRSGPTDFPDPRFANSGIAVLPRLDEIHPDLVLLSSALALAAAFCLMIGLIGIWRVMSSDAMRTLRDGGRSGTTGPVSHRLRASFVVVEVALSLVLLSGSAVLGRSVSRLLGVQPGFDPTNVITFWTSPPRSTYRSAEMVGRFYRDAVDRIAHMPGVIAAGIVSKPPLQFAQTRRPVWIEDAPAPNGALPRDYAIAASNDTYFRAMGIPVLAGRVFDDANVQRGDNEAVVSRGFVLQNWRDSTGNRGLGRRFRPGGDVGPWYTIVGVVGDVRDTSLAAPAEAQVYLPEEPGLDPATRERGARDMAFVVRTRGPAAGFSERLRREIHAVDASVPVYELSLMTETISTSNSRMRFALYLLAAGAGATLLLGIVGLFGVIAYVVGMRSREIGIRIALGLAPNKATQLIVRQGIAIVVAGTAIGLAVFVIFAKLLRTLTFEVSVVDTAALGTAASVVVIVAILATWIPARRAARIDPAEALKNE